MASGDTLVEQSKSLNLENDLNYFMSEYSAPFNTPTNFQFTPFDGDDVSPWPVTKKNLLMLISRFTPAINTIASVVSTPNTLRSATNTTASHFQCCFNTLYLL